MLFRRLLCGLVLVLANAGGRAATFDDGFGGVTCGFYSSLGRLAWQRPGGDWVDARAISHGETPFAETAVVRSKAPQRVIWDLLPLLAEWASGRIPSGSVMLRVAHGDKAGPVNFASREQADQSIAPILVVNWSDGQVDRLGPIADTFLDCSTYKGLGSGPVLKVGTGQSALLEFLFQARPGHTVSSLSLALTALKQYGRTARIGAYGPRLPRAATADAAGVGLSQALQRDAGIDKLKDVLFVQNFEDESWKTFVSGKKTADSLRTLTEDQGNRFKPLSGKALAVTIRKNEHQALNHHLRFAAWPGGEPEEAYFRYHLRLAQNWDPVVDGGKLPGFAGTYGKAGWGMRPSDGTNGWSARGAFMRHDAQGSPTTSWRAVGTYAYTANTESRSGDIWGWNLGPTGRLEKNRWYSIEQYVKLNTPGQPDGVMRAWVDGQLAFEKNNVQWRDIATLKIESVWLNVYHGGTAKTDRDLTLYMDNLVVARRYIGPGNFSP